MASNAMVRTSPKAPPRMNAGVPRPSGAGSGRAALRRTSGSTEEQELALYRPGSYSSRKYACSPSKAYSPHAPLLSELATRTVEPRSRLNDSFTRKV